MDIVEIPLEQLHSWPSNARQHDERNIAAIRASLRTFGQVEPLVVQKSTMGIIGGNGQLEAMKLEGWKAAKCYVLEIDDVKAQALGIALNRTAELAEWNPEVLNQNLKELVANDFDVSMLDFTPEDILGIVGETLGTGAVDPDDVPLPADKATTQKGDIWVLGDHRLMCGDSGSPADLDLLLAGNVIHLVNTDPPYNVKVEPRSNNAIAAGLSSFAGYGNNANAETPGFTSDVGRDVHRNPGSAKATHAKMRAKDRPLANDFVTDEAFDALLDAWFGNISRVLVPGGTFYIWGGYANIANYPPVLKAHGLYFTQWIIWVKMHPVLTRKDFMGNHEVAFYGWKEGAGHKFYGPNNVTDVWDVKKVNPQSMVHLTEKPVELAVRAMQYSSLPGQNVLDLFGGSGSTMMAAETTGRHAFSMELDELYCDVILWRWEKFTGKKARLEDGRTFTQVRADRGTETQAAPAGAEAALPA